MADDTLLDPTFLFRFEIALQRKALTWTKHGLDLPESCRLPSFGALAGRPLFADVRLAWDTKGIGFWVQTSGKRQLPWCREGRSDVSDGLHLWIDTRNSPDIHRANRFCHRFALMPFGGGPKRESAYAEMMTINRARMMPNPVPRGAIQIFGKPLTDGYQMSGVIPAIALTGFDQAEYSTISLWYSVIDRECGSQTFSLSSEYPTEEDPSLWGSARLVG
jgi:hypothetical protein